jgi:hypothetical protein
MLKAALFESVAVPEIRNQAQQLAQALLAAQSHADKS